jgi:hypothetical protein
LPDEVPTDGQRRAMLAAALGVPVAKWRTCSVVKWRTRTLGHVRRKYADVLGDYGARVSGPGCCRSHRWDWFPKTGFGATMAPMAPKIVTPRETALQVIELIAEGYSMREACRQLKVGNHAFRLWCERDPDIASQYARAREVGDEILADEIQDIADEPVSDDALTAGAFEQRRRARIDSRKWILARRRPTKWGDRVGIEHSGSLTLDQVIGQTLGLLPQQQTLTGSQSPAENVEKSDAGDG